LDDKSTDKLKATIYFKIEVIVFFVILRGVCVHQEGHEVHNGPRRSQRSWPV